MKFNKTDKHSRCLLVTGLKDQIGELEILVGYTGVGTAAKGIPLDNEIIPRILACGECADYTDAQKKEIGNKLAAIFNLKKVRRGFEKQSSRYSMGEGYINKTAIGVFEVVRDLGRRIEKGEAI